MSEDKFKNQIMRFIQAIREPYKPDYFLVSEEEALKGVLHLINDTNLINLAKEKKRGKTI